MKMKLIFIFKLLLSVVVYLKADEDVDVSFFGFDGEFTPQYHYNKMKQVMIIYCEEIGYFRYNIPFGRCF